MPIDREHVFDMIREGRTAVVLGGDASLYEGMCTNSRLISALASACNYPEGFPLSLVEVGEYYAELRGHNQLLERVIQLVDSTSGESLLLKKLAEVKKLTEFFATTLDEHLQNYFSNKEMVVIRSDTDIPRAFSRPRRLYRLNGSIAGAERMIVTREALLQQLNRGMKSPILLHLAFNLSSRQFLIFGHEMKDWNFAFYFQQVTAYLGEFREKAILFNSKVDSVLASYWNKRNVEVMAEDPVEFLSQYQNWEKVRK